MASRTQGPGASARTQRRAQRREFLRKSKSPGFSLPRPATVINAPDVLTFDGTREQREQTRRFFRDLRYAQTSDGQRRGRALAELAGLREMSLGAALMLVAEFDRWQRVTTSRLAPETIEQWNKGVVERLVALGFFDLLQTKVPLYLRRSKTPEWIPFVSGVKTVGRAARLLRIRLETLLQRESGVGAEIYIALVECMKNAFQHAYPNSETTHPLVGKRWWMAASVNHEARTVDVAFLDLGITIPRSLPTSWLWSRMAESSKGRGDHLVIAEAIEYGRSRMQEDHRGKGFRNIRHPTLLNGRNRVVVTSGRGLCVDLGGNVIAIGEDTGVAGTLIEWKFHLEWPQVTKEG